jgi:hypothetical protein
MERINRLRKAADAARDKYEAARKQTDIRFPGSFVAGPANYPVARHNKAWGRVDKLRAEAQEAQEKYEAAQRHAENMAQLSQETAEQVAENGDGWLNEIQPGDLIRFRFTNCGNAYEAVGTVLRVNARTIRQQVVRFERKRQLPDGEWQEYGNDSRVGRSWAIPKMGSGENRIIERMASEIAT